MVCPPAAQTIRCPLPLHPAAVQQQQQAGKEQKGPAPHPLIKKVRLNTFISTFNSEHQFIHIFLLQMLQYNKKVVLWKTTRNGEGGRYFFPALQILESKMDNNMHKIPRIINRKQINVLNINWKSVKSMLYIIRKFLKHNFVQNTVGYIMSRLMSFLFLSYFKVNYYENKLLSLTNLAEV